MKLEICLVYVFFDLCLSGRHSEENSSTEPIRTILQAPEGIHQMIKQPMQKIKQTPKAKPKNLDTAKTLQKPLETE